MIRKILYISGTRADYGLMRSVLRKIHEHPSLSLDIIVTGMHLMEEFGNTIEDVESSIETKALGAKYGENIYIGNNMPKHNNCVSLEPKGFKHLVWSIRLVESSMVDRRKRQTASK